MSTYKLKYLLLAFCLVLLCSEMNSQSRNVIGKNVSPKTAISKEEKTSFSTKRLAFSITRNARTDSEKIRDIYNWIVYNISYDIELMQSEKLQKQIYTSEGNIIRNVLKRKMAICGGFALLFKSLCLDVGLQAEAVNGFTKDYSERIKERKVPNHTWNVVKVNGQWRLLDITWAIGHGKEDAPDNFWYFTSPKEFIYSHYPEDVKWTLIENPISFSDFQKNQ
ncbi:transglutaminase domain-containing protein [Aequorivita capsosiphonis]|uniref:transglutaminase domain-containing protein n=1 Tax=Aequorivita capsosiphonis TaxID=487317 RepID=UPI00040FE981|nr:transglutaminase domain-containing protein [Aequorivita capsosiphonis]